MPMHNSKVKVSPIENIKPKERMLKIENKKEKAPNEKKFLVKLLCIKLI